MASPTRSKFTSHLLLWIILSFAVEAMVMPALISPVKEMALINTEMKINKAFMGRGQGTITNRATWAFKGLFVNNGIMAKSAHFFQPSESSDVLGLGRIYKGISAKWIDNFWMSVYLFLYRFFLMIYWIIPASLFIGAAAVDGFTIWQIKKTEFGVSNPIAFKIASMSIAHITGFMVFLGFVPLPMPPFIWPFFTAMIASSVWITAANFQSGLSSPGI
ncbi:MAG: DUF4400 domain-containing protein [Pseudomonadota bacterium]|nr:DUF4400 domain-containing protein [Pseudomonadota bacterium]